MYPKIQNHWKMDQLNQNFYSRNSILELKSSFNLKSTTRDKLVWYLSKFLAILDGKNFSFDDEENLINSGVKLISILNNLSLESNEIKTTVNENIKSNKLNEDEEINVILQLDPFLKTELISHFSMLNDFIFNQNNTKNNYLTKDNLIISNNNLIQSLMSLPVAFIERIDDKKFEQLSCTNNQSINSAFYFNYDDNDEIRIIQKRIDSYSKILYIFELNDVSKFLKSGLNNSIQSDFICCNGFLWKVWIRNSIVYDSNGEEIRLIDFGITCCNYNSNINSMLIDIKSKLTVFTNFANRSNKETNYSIQHISAKQCKMVWKRFIAVKELTKLSNGFIKQNKFNFSIDLEVIKRSKLKKNKCLIM